MGSPRPLFAMRGFVGQDGVERTIGHGHFINAQLRAEVLRKEHPRVGMVSLAPGGKVAQVILVLLFKLFGRDLLGSGNGGQRCDFRLCRLLLKKRRTRVPAAFPERPA